MVSMDAMQIESYSNWPSILLPSCTAKVGKRGRRKGPEGKEEAQMAIEEGEWALQVLPVLCCKKSIVLALCAGWNRPSRACSPYAGGLELVEGFNRSLGEEEQVQ